jgi:hypothetical protein
MKYEHEWTEMIFKDCFFIKSNPSPGRSLKVDVCVKCGRMKIKPGEIERLKKEKERKLSRLDMRDAG